MISAVRYFSSTGYFLWKGGNEKTRHRGETHWQPQSSLLLDLNNTVHTLSVTLQRDEG